MTKLSKAAAIAASCVCVSLSLGWSPATAKSDKAAAGDTVNLAGCVAAGVEAGCMIVKSGGETYDVSGLGLKLNDDAHGTAVVTDKLSHCMQGPVLADYKPNSQKPPACVPNGKVDKLKK